MRLLRVGLLVLGVVLLGVLIAWNDPAAIFASIVRLSWRLLVLLCFPIVLVTIFDTLGWRFAFADDRVAFRTLLWARLAGEAFNMTTPTAALGGEAVKAWLLRPQVPLARSVSSVIVAKTAITIAQGLFLLVGVGLAWLTILPGSPLLHAMQWLLVLETLALAGFVLAQMRGVLGWGTRALERLGLGGFRGRHAVARVDAALVQFYRYEPKRFALSVTFHLIAWLLGSVEAYLILQFLGSPVPFVTATVIEAFGTAIRFATFLIPASLGVLEGGFVATFVALGLSSTTGLTFSLVRRLREAVWIGLGLVAFACTSGQVGRLTDLPEG